jgi:hypothetical protein
VSQQFLVGHGLVASVVRASGVMGYWDNGWIRHTLGGRLPRITGIMCSCSPHEGGKP